MFLSRWLARRRQGFDWISHVDGGVFANQRDYANETVIRDLYVAQPATGALSYFLDVLASWHVTFRAVRPGHFADMLWRRGFRPQNGRHHVSDDWSRDPYMDDQPSQQRTAYEVRVELEDLWREVFQDEIRKWFNLPPVPTAGLVMRQLAKTVELDPRDISEAMQEHIANRGTGRLTSQDIDWLDERAAALEILHTPNMVRTVAPEPLVLGLF